MWLLHGALDSRSLSQQAPSYANDVAEAHGQFNVAFKLGAAHSKLLIAGYRNCDHFGWSRRVCNGYGCVASSQPIDLQPIAGQRRRSN